MRWLGGFGMEEGSTLRQVLARAIGGVAVIGLVAGAAACNSTSSDDKASGGNGKCGYSLAFFGALTGSAANLGVNIEQGFELAVDQFNKAKGSDCITVAKFDSQGEAEV